MIAAGGVSHVLIEKLSASLFLKPSHRAILNHLVDISIDSAFTYASHRFFKRFNSVLPVGVFFKKRRESFSLCSLVSHGLWFPQCSLIILLCFSFCELVANSLYCTRSNSSIRLLLLLPFIAKRNKSLAKKTRGVFKNRQKHVSASLSFLIVANTARPARYYAALFYAKPRLSKIQTTEPLFFALINAQRLLQIAVKGAVLFLDPFNASVEEFLIR